MFAIPTTGGSETILHSFTGGSDGGDPGAGLLNVGTNLYGTTFYGTVFSLPLSGGSISILYTFSGPNDGGAPSALINVGQYLYGTTEYGGAHGYGGTVFRVPIAGGHDELLYSFSNGVDGGLPTASLINVGSNLYGTTQAGGSTNNGTVFSVPLSGGSEVVMHSFTDGLDGADPTSPLALINNKLYGMTDFGGGVGPSGDGTIFSLPVIGGIDTIVHPFNRAVAKNDSSLGALLQVGGHLYGVTSTGGIGFGSVFKL